MINQLKSDLFRISSRIAEFAENFFDLLGVEQNGKLDSVNAAQSDLSIFVQKLDFKDINLRSAQKAVALQIGRLSPISPRDIYWNVQPNNDEYFLGIIRKEDISLLRKEKQLDSGHLNINYDERLTFEFLDDEARQRKTLKFWMILSWLILCYALFYFALTAWTIRVEGESVQVTQKISDLSYEIGELNVTRERAELDVLLLEQQFSREELISVTTQLSGVSQTLSEDEWVDSYSLTEDGAKIAVFVSNENRFMSDLTKALPNWKIRILGASRDPVSGLTRTIFNIQPVSTGDSK